MAVQSTATARTPVQFLGWTRDDRKSARNLTKQKALDRKPSRGGLQLIGKGPQLGCPCSRGLAPLRVLLVELYGRQIPGRRHRESSAVVFAAASMQQEKAVVGLPISVDYISSPNNAYIKHLVRLRQSSKMRSATSSVLVVGTVPLREICEAVEALKRKHTLVDMLLVREDAQIPEGLAKVSRRIVRMGLDAMSKLSGLDSPPEVAGVLPFPPNFMSFPPYRDSGSSGAQMSQWCSSPRRILVLDAIQDPGNLGTLLRTAAAFAWDSVFLLHGCCDPFNDKALRASRGASFRVPIGVGDWNHVRELADSSGLKLYAADPKPEMGSENGVSTSKLDGDFKVLVDGGQGLCLVLGSEGQGLSDYVARDCAPVGIHMPGDFESLNVAVAGGILMFLLR